MHYFVTIVMVSDFQSPKQRCLRTVSVLRHGCAPLWVGIFLESFFFFFHDILTGLQHLSLVSYSLLYLLNLVQLVPSRTFSPQQIPLPQPKHTTRDWCHWSSRKVQKTLPPNCFHTKLVSGSKCSILHFVCSVFSCSFSCISVSAAPPVVSRGVLA